VDKNRLDDVYIGIPKAEF